MIYKITKHSAKIIYVRPSEPSPGSVLLLSLPFLSEKEFLLQQQMPPGTKWHSLAISAQRLMKYLLSLRVSEEVISPAQNWDSVMRQDKDDSSANAHPSPVLTEKKKMGFIHMFKESRKSLCRKSINTALHCSQGEGSQRQFAIRAALFPCCSPHAFHCSEKNYLGSSREYDWTVATAKDWSLKVITDILP